MTGKRRSRILTSTALGTVGAALVLAAPANAADAGSSADTPVVLTSLADLPTGAVLTGSAKSDCATISSYTLHVDGHEATTTPEYQFKREVPGTGAVSHLEYRYTKSAELYTVEHKSLKGWMFDTTKSGSVWIGGKTFAGQWVNKFNQTWYPLADAMVAAAGINPFSVAESGILPANIYGYGQGSTSYMITSIDTFLTQPAGAFVHVSPTTVYYTGPGSEVSVNAADAAWVSETTMAGWSRYGASRTFIDQAATPGRTEYYVEGAAPTTVAANASWVKFSSLAGWTQLGTRGVANQDAVPGYDRYYSFDDNVQCVVERVLGEAVEAPAPKKHRVIPMAVVAGEAPESSGPNTGLIVMAGIGVAAAGSLVAGRRIAARREAGEL